MGQTTTILVRRLFMREAQMVNSLHIVSLARIFAAGQDLIVKRGEVVTLLETKFVNATNW